MNLLLELLNLLESAIPPKVAGYMNAQGISYKARTLEELEREHAKALLRTVKPSGAEEGLSRMLGLHGLSREELQDITQGATA